MPGVGLAPLFEERIGCFDHREKNTRLYCRAQPRVPSRSNFSAIAHPANIMARTSNPAYLTRDRLIDQVDF
jgi:hypothetical protein